MKKHPPRRAQLTVRPAHRLLSPPFLFVSSSSSSSSPCSEPFPVRNRSKKSRGGVANQGGCLLHGRPKTAREGGSGARTIDRPPTDRRRRRDSCEERSTRKQRGFAPDPSEGRSREGECWDDRHLNIASSPYYCCCRRIVSPERPKMPFQIPNSHSSGRGWCVTQDQPDDGSTRAKNTVHLSDTHTHTHATQCQQAGRRKIRRVRGAVQPRPQEATTHRQTHTHTPHGKSAKKSQPKPDEMGAGWCPLDPTRVSSFVCDMRVCGPPVSASLGSGFRVLALYLSTVGSRIAWKNQMGILSQNAASGGNDNRILLSRSTPLLKCLVVRSGSGRRGDSENQRLALALMLSSPMLVGPWPCHWRNPLPSQALLAVPSANRPPCPWNHFPTCDLQTNPCNSLARCPATGTPCPPYR